MKDRGRQGWRTIAIASCVLCACTGGEAGDGARTTTDTAQAAHTERSGSPGYDRASFILCPALEDHRTELAALIGFEHDPDRTIAGVGTECIIHGRRIGFVRVSIPPAIVRTIPMAITGYDAPANPAPELGEDAVFVDVPLQPHVIFTIGGLIVDVDAENVETPSREKMIELALRVRELLEEANS